MHQGGGGGGGRGGICRLKEHLAGVKGQVKSREAPLDVIGHIKEEMQKVLNYCYRSVCSLGQVAEG
jgi:hypothetical protein